MWAKLEGIVGAESESTFQLPRTISIRLFITRLAATNILRVFAFFQCNPMRNLPGVDPYRRTFEGTTSRETWSADPGRRDKLSHTSDLVVPPIRGPKYGDKGSKNLLQTV
jgi:hypothetical protein